MKKSEKSEKKSCYQKGAEVHYGHDDGERESSSLESSSRECLLAEQAASEGVGLQHPLSSAGHNSVTPLRPQTNDWLLAHIDVEFHKLD